MRNLESDLLPTRSKHATIILSTSPAPRPSVRGGNRNEEAMKETKPNAPKRKRNSRQIVAIVGVALLILLYVVTLVAAIADSSQSAGWFRICLFGTFALPLVIWIYSWMYGRLTGKKTIGDPDKPEAAAADKAAADKASGERQDQR